MTVVSPNFRQLVIQELDSNKPLDLANPALEDNLGVQWKQQKLSFGSAASRDTGGSHYGDSFAMLDMPPDKNVLKLLEEQGRYIMDENQLYLGVLLEANLHKLP
ncbi:hypothetical protein H634G_00797 [Metarhizium anisopliae BRIP 53293]|uniref:Uncharacterized protein n=1 Tax=Metarhizium anisopliae BRIP 53293 TaxID=1291518 RepID=A0A0D9PE70_METAN|nr:hypothetical protein H634G_00797 [Metarhizium anisopliae BRIP 53293]KJK93550.1 hypothetical protein H633G_02591 [Metarhizium anisopliae BRIP 53284]